ncbi:hypothetical protein C8R46DRAFT_670493 [Mycena filopes]|nr:hypothetical protein C8R46DRAFT_670493 [Mycena filopes]
MDSKRAKTLDALAAFIAQQREVIARTQSDVHTLRELKAEAVARADVGALAVQVCVCAALLPIIHGSISPPSHYPRPRTPLLIGAFALYTRHATLCQFFVIAITNRSSQIAAQWPRLSHF